MDETISGRFVTKLHALKSIELNESSLTSYEPLKDIAALRNLDFSAVDHFQKTAFLAELPNLQKLHLRDIEFDFFSYLTSL